jgi:translation initiation factor IF-3
VGVVSTKEALSMAQEVGLDLVLVAANAEPPVARIVNYGKHKYEQAKLKKDQKKVKQDVKGIKISPNIAENDLNTQARKAKQFLIEGHKVRVVCRFRQRELAHPEVGARKMEMVAALIDEVGKREKDPLLNGKEMVMVINPKVTGGVKKDAKTENKQDSSEEVQNHGERQDHAPQVDEQPPVQLQIGEPETPA